MKKTHLVISCMIALILASTLFLSNTGFTENVVVYAQSESKDFSLIKGQPVYADSAISDKNAADPGSSSDQASEFLPCSSETEIPQSECLALVSFYNATDGEEWSSQAGWLTNDTPCSWYGVSCTDGSVTGLEVSKNNLSGTIPTVLVDLPNLTSLDLHSNNLSGTIPPELGNLVHLTVLRLDSAQLTGSIPPELGNLTNLTQLNLVANQLSGSIPTEMGNLVHLTALSLGDNQLTGSIPTILGNLTDLSTELNLGGNQLSGSIPPELGNLVNLSSLELLDNQLSGSIPPELGNLTSLTELRLDKNQLTGGIPVQLGNLTNLEFLGLGENPISGNVPPELGNLTKLTTLWIQWTQLSGSLPLELTNLTHLAHFIYYQTYLCDPTDAAFQAWLATIPDKTEIMDCLLPPGLIGPTNNSTISDSTPTFSWKAVSGAAKYQLMVDDAATFTSPVYTSPFLTTTSKTLTTALSQKAYYWRVRVKDSLGNYSPWSKPWKVTIDTTPPAAPALKSPLNNSATNDTTPTFTWYASSGAVKYQLMVDDATSFTTPVYTSPALSTTSKTLTTALPPKTYYWRVKAADIAGNWSAWSTVRKLIIDTTPPATPVLKTPANGSSTNDRTPTFVWYASSGATGYQLVVDNATNFTTPVYTSPTLTTTTKTLTTALPPKTYYWRVRARDAAGNWSAWSKVWKVIIK